jgi:hypothetical protein
MKNGVFSRFLVFLTIGYLLPAQAQIRNPEQLRILTDGYPRAFFFRASEGPPARPNPDYERWDADFNRLMGIIGKCLDEEVLGRQQNNPAFFSRFKRAHPEQVVLLHLNGNARDPRYEASTFFAGHWVYRTPADILEDVPCESGETTIKVSDARLFRMNMGRYANRHDDIALFGVTPTGGYDWHDCEQVQLLAVNTKANTIRVCRAQYGTHARAFKAGTARAVAHQVEGPWGRNNSIMWYYNFSTHCPRDRQGKTAADRYVDDIARWFGPYGLLAAYDGLEFDVLHSTVHGDTDGNGSQDNGVSNGTNVYSLGVVEFVRTLRERMGDRFILQADGALGEGGSNSQRAWGLLNGIESEGWPDLRDSEIHDWSGGLNRQNYWQAFAAKPAFNYINHKFSEPVPGGKPGDRRNAKVGFNIHRLVFAAACFTDAALCYSFAPQSDRSGRFGIWDELRCGTDNQLGWLGQPLGPAVHLAGQSPDLLPDKSLDQLVSGPVTAKVTSEGIRITPNHDSDQGFNFSLRGVRTNGPDLTTRVVMKGGALESYPATVARYAQLEVSTGANLIAGNEPVTGMCLRGHQEKPIDPSTGARCHSQKIRIDGAMRSALAVHPPYVGRVGYTYWTRDVTVPPDSDLHYAIGMGPKSPMRSDGVWFSVHAAVMKEGQCGPFSRLAETSSKAHAWIPQRVSLAAYGGKTLRLKFMADCGPQDNSTTDHAYWSDVALLPRGTDLNQRTRPERFMTWLGTEFFESTFYYRHIASNRVDLTFHMEGRASVTLQSITVHNQPDVMYRLFEKGLVLANPSLKDYTFDLSKIAPDRHFRRIKATANQDAATNNGTTVGKTVTLGPKDGLFLISTNH